MVRVEGVLDGGFSMPRLSLRERRPGHPTMLRWVMQRHVENVLFARSDGGSTGAVWKLLNQTGLGRTSLIVNKSAANQGIVTTKEMEEVLQIFRQTSARSIDPCSLGRVRSCTLLPVATVACICRIFGRSPASVALLRALSQHIPESWESEAEREALAARGEVDLLLEEAIEGQDFEAEDKSFGDELTEMAPFSVTAEDEAKMSNCVLDRPPSLLVSELGAYIAFRTDTFAARRTGGAVVSCTSEGDRQSLLRFYGWLHRSNRLPDDAFLYLSLLARPDVGDLVQDYASWMQQELSLRFSTIANYLNGLVSVMSYVYNTTELPETTLAMEPTPLTMVINLRAQAEKQSRTQNMFDKRVGGWCTWDQVQQARVKAVELLNASSGGNTPQYVSLLRDTTAISLLSLVPPDRVGLIRKLRFGHTLKRREGGWRLDLTKARDGHKTSRFYGPFAAALPDELTGVLNAYAAVLELEVDGTEAYLFHPTRSGAIDRPVESSAWTAYVRALFTRLVGSAVAPKTLRSIFITWIR